jgi:hypothetical protein
MASVLCKSLVGGILGLILSGVAAVPVYVILHTYMGESNDPYIKKSGRWDPSSAVAISILIAGTVSGGFIWFRRAHCVYREQREHGIESAG